MSAPRSSRLRALFSSPRLIRAACLMCLASLATTAWAVLDPHPLVVIFAMSVGQGLGILGMLLYGVVVVRDVRPRLKRGGGGRGPDGDPEG